MNDHCLCMVEVSPSEVDAGGDVTMTVRVECPRPDLKRPSLSIRDQDDAELARAELKASVDGYACDDIVLAAPQSVGEFVYRAVVLAAGQNDVLQEQTSTEVRVVSRMHEAQLNVWDVPSAIATGETFKFMVGVRCSAGCRLAGHTVSIIDRDGLAIDRFDLGSSVWPQTDALYFAEVEADAPANPGVHQWSVATAASTSGLPHAAGTRQVSLRVVAPPNCAVTVAVIDGEKRIPIEGALVVMHPYRATTGENGLATLKVAEGQYDALISASSFRPFNRTIDVTGDVTMTAELDTEPPWDPDGDV